MDNRAAADMLPAKMANRKLAACLNFLAYSFNA